MRRARRSVTLCGETTRGERSELSIEAVGSTCAVTLRFGIQELRYRSNDLYEFELDLRDLAAASSVVGSQSERTATRVVDPHGGDGYSNELPTPIGIWHRRLSISIYHAPARKRSPPVYVQASIHGSVMLSILCQREALRRFGEELTDLLQAVARQRDEVATKRRAKEVTDE